jgi:hypothetical protein
MEPDEQIVDLVFSSAFVEARNIFFLWTEADPIQ